LQSSEKPPKPSKDKQKKEKPWWMPPKFKELTIVAVTGVLSGCLARRYYHRRKERILQDLPKGLPLSREELAAQLVGADLEKRAARSKERRAAPTSEKKLSGEWSEWSEFELAFHDDGKQGGAVYVFDAPSEERYVVVGVCRCTHGPPLLPGEASGGGLEWTPPDTPELHLATYLATCMRRFSGVDWSDRIASHLNDQPLVFYHAAVKEDHWRELWDTMMKPFAEQRTLYRRIHKTKKAPELFFGVKPRIASRELDVSTAGSTSQTGHASSGDAGASAATTGPSVWETEEGLRLPGAEAWLEFWRHTDIPTNRTFVDFAQSLTESVFPRRSTSSPDLSNLVVSEDKPAHDQ
jgi:hypothetical protein